MLVSCVFSILCSHTVLTVLQTLVLSGEFTVARGEKDSVLDTVFQQLPVALVNGHLLLLKHLAVTPERLKSTGMLVTAVFSSGKNGKDCHWQAQKDKTKIRQ